MLIPVERGLQKEWQGETNGIDTNSADRSRIRRSGCPGSSTFWANARSSKDLGSEDSFSRRPERDLHLDRHVGACIHSFRRHSAYIRRVHVLLAIMAYFGVTTFFVISGFLITKLLLREHMRTSQVDLGRFYRRRAVRIFPAALCYILIVLLMAKVTAGQAAYALTFTTTYFFDYAAKPLQQLWSLSVEEQFYLLWPLAFCFGMRNAKRYCWVIMFASPIIRILLKHHGYTQYSHLAPAIGDSLAAGCLLAFYEKQVAAFVKDHFRSTAVFLRSAW